MIRQRNTIVHSYSFRDIRFSPREKFYLQLDSCKDTHNFEIIERKMNYDNYC